MSLNSDLTIKSLLLRCPG